MADLVLARRLAGGLTFAALFAVILAPVARGQQAITLAERFEPQLNYRVSFTVELSGEMTAPAPAQQKEAKFQVLKVRGNSTLEYDERPLPMVTDGVEQLVRQYRSISIRRTVGDQPQEADIRKPVRRLVISRTAKGKSAFSPDGPLKFEELDIIRTDFFTPTLVRGLLPKTPVKPGTEWTATPDAIIEVTDLETINDGQLLVTFLGTTIVKERKHARLALKGTLRGVDEHGPCRHTIEGTAYFDMVANRLVYLSIKGTHELLDGTGGIVGRIEGRSQWTRDTVTAEAELADRTLQSLSLTPDAQNTRLLYDNPDLGVKFIYPRRWRVASIQGRQLTLAGPNGAGILMTLEPPANLPTAIAYLKESEDYFKKVKAPVTNIVRPTRVRQQPVLDRFQLETVLAEEKLRMCYAVQTERGGGIILASRLPIADADALEADLVHIVSELQLTKVLK